MSTAQQWADQELEREMSRFHKILDAEPKLELGRTYKTKGGDEVTMMVIHRQGSSYETMSDQHGHHRYSSRKGDIGRVTGTAHDFSYHGNIDLDKQE